MTTFLRAFVLGIVALAILSAARLGAAQTGYPPRIQRPEDENQSQARKEMERRRLLELNKQRQMELKRDTDRLLQLATELKLYVDKTNENMLSLDVIKKAEEIEKLAKSVKGKMRGYN
ncbi:MAG: hypothetical protein ACE14L_07880 [Terriglobales bacterium]